MPRAFAQFSVQANLVEVYATVTDGAGRPLTGLGPEDFIVEEDGARQPIAAFAGGALPLALGVAIDRSFSVPAATLPQITSAARGLVDRLATDDEVMLIAIGSETEVLASLGTDREPVRRGLERLERWGSTPLFDAVIQAVDLVQPARGRRGLILLSDGVDRYSRAGASDVTSHVRRHDVLVYPVAIGPERPAVWSEVASVSGGRSFHARDARTLPSTLDAIVEELRHQYLLGYAPPATGRPGWRAIRVGVNRPGARVRAREGYLAPSP